MTYISATLMSLIRTLDFTAVVGQLLDLFTLPARDQSPHSHGECVYMRLKPSSQVDYFSCHNSEHQVGRDELFHSKEFEGCSVSCTMFSAHPQYRKA